MSTKTFQIYIIGEWERANIIVKWAITGDAIPKIVRFSKLMQLTIFNKSPPLALHSRFPTVIVLTFVLVFCSYIYGYVVPYSCHSP